MINLKKLNRKSDNPPPPPPPPPNKTCGGDSVMVNTEAELGLS